MNNTGADQPGHRRSLISAFVIISIICNLATGEISIFQLVSIAEETGLKHALSKTPQDKFSRNDVHITGSVVFIGFFTVWMVNSPRGRCLNRPHHKTNP